MRARSGLDWGLALVLLGAGLSCMRAAPPRDTRQDGPEILADSVTIGLWRMDEAGGDRIEDAGPARLEGTSGHDTRGDFGRVRGARVFTKSIESFVYVPYSPALESPDSMSVEAWIYPYSFTVYEDSPIAGRWTELANEQSWLFSIVGQKILSTSPSLLSPGYHLPLVTLGRRGHLMFAIQSQDAGLPGTYFSTSEIELNRWTHVAATLDGQVLRLYVNGRLDAQYALASRIRETHAPLLVGNYFDTRWLTDFGGTLRVGSAVDRTPYYAFDGLIDELRLSRTARREFPGIGGK